MTATAASAEAPLDIIEGKAVAGEIVERVRIETGALAGLGVKPGLAVVLVGHDPASQVYVRNKTRVAAECGFQSQQHDLPAETSEAQLTELVKALNADPAVHGILVQFPLPGGIDTTRIVETIDPAKDVDGFHPINAGLLAIGQGRRAMIPCTPAGALLLAERAFAALGRTLDGAEAVIVGRSNLVGKPMAQLLLSRGCTVTLAHSRTRDLPDVVRRAELLVAAVGKPELIRGDWLRPGAVVIDVGINRVAAPGEDAQGKPRSRLVGDVAFAEARGRVAAITPVPGGVGPMTIAMLMVNTLKAACRANGVAPPEF